MSTTTCIHHSGDVNTPAGSVPLTLPQCSPHGHASPAKSAKETAAVLFVADEKQDEDSAAAKEKEKGDANKKMRSAASSSCCSKQTGEAPTTKKERKKKSAVESPKNKEKRQANFSPDEDFMPCCAYINVLVDPIIGAGQKSKTFQTRVLGKYILRSTEQYLAEICSYREQFFAKVRFLRKKSLTWPEPKCCVEFAFLSMYLSFASFAVFATFANSPSENRSHVNFLEGVLIRRQLVLSM